MTMMRALLAALAITSSTALNVIPSYGHESDRFLQGTANYNGPQCASAPTCAKAGLAGNCCPTADNVFLDCCYGIEPLGTPTTSLNLRILLGNNSGSAGANGPNYPNAVGTVRTFYSKAVEFDSLVPLGWLSGSCIVTKIGTAAELGGSTYVEHCTAVFDGGDQGQISYATDLYRAPDAPGAVYIVINGGSKAYKGAGGQIIRTNVAAAQKKTDSASEQQYYFEFSY